MWKITRKLMGANARMLIPAGIAIFLGSVFVTCALLFGNVLDVSMRQSLTEQFGAANYMISVDEHAKETPQEQSLDLNKLTAIDHVEGVRQERSLMLDLGTPSSTKHVTSMITQMGDVDSMNPVQVQEGALPQSADEIAVPESFAKQLGVTLGSTVTVADPAQSDHSMDQEYTVTGFTAENNSQYAYYGGVALLNRQAMDRYFSVRGAAATDDADVQEELAHSDAQVEDTPAYFPSVYVRVGDFPKNADGQTDYADAAQVERKYADTLQAIKDIMPKGTVLESRTQVADQRLKNMGGGVSGATTTFLMVFAVLAMFVAALVIANTFQVLVAQRKRILALLRTIGAKRGQVYRSVILEGAILGIISTILAVLVGIGLMVLMIVLMPRDNSMFGLIALRDLGRVITPSAVFIPIVFGTTVTMIACTGSARAATRVSPLEALQSVDTLEQVSKGKLRLTFGILFIVLGIGAAVASIVGVNALNDPANSNNADSNNLYSMYLLISMAACMIVMIGMLMLTQRWVPAMLSGVGTIVRRIGASSRVASANLKRNPKRVAATSAALLIGVTLIATLSTGAASVRQTLSTTLDEHYSVDVIVNKPQSTLTSKQRDAVAAVDGVSGAVLVNYVDMLTPKGNTIRLYAPTSQDQLNTVMNEHTGVMPEQDQLIIPQSYTEGEDPSWKNGQEFKLTNADGTKTLTLTTHTAPYRSLTSGTVYYAMVSPQDLREAHIEYAGNEIWAKVANKNDATAAVNAIRQALGDQQDIIVGGSVAERSLYDQMITVILQVLLALIAVAMIIAIIGVANTLSLSVIERTRESATLRAIGMTRAQLRKSLAIEAVMIAVVAGIVGIIVGTLFGWLGTYIVCSLMGKVSFAFDWLTAGAIIVGGIVCALLASILPARRAVRTPPVVALAQAD
ncbi:ABC transporter ATP-binding protein [Galliscardovia ingluviei]|uniref:ABC transporter ATP-binding protein n=1 Tax=Galliscardovia ingluviei TaxID=1769422 RepID=A0A8J3EXG2_9BIFI|nr:FtsX-like permease family protein [Galliscardovia ingluviei]GGI12814.1 ABC transporter ATP-binding protein [Galliscardovia ingluviei]